MATPGLGSIWLQVGERFIPGQERSAATVDKTGPAPYWQSYEYDLTGNRTNLTAHNLDGDTARDVTKTYKYPPAGAEQPHALQSVTTVTPPIPGGSPGGTSVDSFKYDETGNTTVRTVGGDDEKLDWDAEAISPRPPREARPPHTSTTRTATG